MTIGYDLPLSATATAHRDSTMHFAVSFGMPAGVTAVRLASVSVDISWDGGSTWTSAPVKDCAVDEASVTTCQVQVKNRARGSASLRVQARDQAGRSVTQTISDAYAVS